MGGKAAKRTRYGKLEVAFGSVNVNGATPDILIGDTAEFVHSPIKELIYAKFKTNAGTPNELELFVDANSVNAATDWTVGKDTTKIDYVIEYVRATGHASAGYAANGIVGYKLALNVLPSAPAVTYPLPATKTTTTATFKGSVASQGAPTTVTIEYGTTTSYGTTVTAAQSPIAAGTTTVTAVTAAVTGLTTGTTYHFRVNATNAAGTVHGTDQTVTTD